MICKTFRAKLKVGHFTSYTLKVSAVCIVHCSKGEGEEKKVMGSGSEGNPTFTTTKNRHIVKNYRVSTKVGVSNLQRNVLILTMVI